MLRRPRLTLRVRFALLMAVAVGVVGAVNRLYFDRRFMNELEGELEWRALGIARHLASDSVNLILFHDLVGLQELVDSGKQTNPDFAYLFVLDPANRVLAHTFEAAFPEALRSINRYHGSAGHKVERMELFGERFRDFALPLYGGELGVLRLGVRDKRLLERVARIRAELLLLLGSVLVLSVAGAYLFTYWSLRPFSDIVSALERFEPGKHREAISLTRQDEIGDLAERIDGITARLHETHRQMMRAERMASVGLMASGIAHEINNPITGIQNCLRRIEASPHDSRQVAEYAAVMLKATGHIESVVRGLLDFARNRPPQMTRLDLCTVVGKAVELTDFRMHKQQAALDLALPRAPVWVQGDEAQLAQVLVNVLLNAVDAMPNGGALRVSLALEGPLVVLRVRDDGVGIAAEELARVFDPFFTTKEVGKGTGLGLAVTLGIVTDHGGDIDIASTPGLGTEVTVRLPAFAEAHEEEHGSA